MTAITVEPATLAASDRCCRCIAQAYVRVSISLTDGGDTDLLFCAHHFGEHEVALRTHPKVILIEDERQRLSPSK